MPTLFETISEYDEDILLMIAENWGIDLDIDQKKDIARQINDLILTQGHAYEFINLLPQKAKSALINVANAEGRLEWDFFIKKFGEFRELGAVKRAKQMPHKNPATITELLFYSGLIGRGFFETRQGLREFSFIPDEFFEILRPEEKSQNIKELASKSGEDISKLKDYRDSILDHACTLLSLIRTDSPTSNLVFSNPGVDVDFLKLLLVDCHLLKNDQEIDTERTKSFLEASRADSFSFLVNAWQESDLVNELNLLPDVISEGGWKNHPHFSRSYILDLINQMPNDKWFSVLDIIDWVHLTNPFFLRTEGEFDSWLVKQIKTGKFLRGLENWAFIEGAYLESMLTGPLVWMRILRLGQTTDNRSYIQKSEWADDLIAGKQITYQSQIKSQLKLDKSGRMLLNRLFPLHARYQIARFSEFINQKGDLYVYQITASSLQNAFTNGLKARQIKLVLNKYASKPIPLNILQALERWAHNGVEVHIKQPVVLFVNSEDIIIELSKTAHKRFLIERLNSTSVIIMRQGIPYIRAWLLDQGYFLDVISDDIKKY